MVRQDRPAISAVNSQGIGVSGLQPEKRPAGVTPPAFILQLPAPEVRFRCRFLASKLTPRCLIKS
jgi:hypothetical protein